MTNKEFVLSVMKKYGKIVAETIQANTSEMSGTELYEEKAFIPDFNPEKQYLNYKAGYVCKSPSGRMVKLIQPYDSTIYTQDPEELPTLWGFYWSINPDDALPFVSMATSPYMIGDCCEHDGKIYKSIMDNNVWSPSEYPVGWEII